MIDLLTGFVGELRDAGLPVSLTESLDAAEAVRHIPLDDRGALRSALGATLVKSSSHWTAFATAFEIYFAVRTRSLEELSGDEDGGVADVADDLERHAGGQRQRNGPALLDPDELRARIAEALAAGDVAALAALARLAVQMFAGIEASRPVGVSYYLHRTMRGINLDVLLADLLATATRPSADDESAASDPLHQRLVVDEIDARAAELRRLVEAEIQQALVATRGSAAVASSLRRPLVEDVEFMHATSEEIANLRRALYPLARALAVRLARRRRHRRRGSLDFRSTIRRSLSTGGVPVEPRFHSARPAKPEIVVIADVSGSVASFARFTLQLVYAMSSQFSQVRTFVFVDGIDEVTKIFERSASVEDAIERVGAEAKVIDADGHSDYGNAFGIFAERWGREITSRSNVIILGDARNNYHGPNVEALVAVAGRARRVWWLNPEPRAYWGSGDSIIGDYAGECDGVFECRNLRQLEKFVDLLV